MLFCRVALSATQPGEDDTSPRSLAKRKAPGGLPLRVPRQRSFHLARKSTDAKKMPAAKVEESGSKAENTKSSQNPAEKQIIPLGNEPLHR